MDGRKQQQYKLQVMDDMELYNLPAPMKNRGTEAMDKQKRRPR